MKGVHFQIVVNNSEWGNIFILKQSISTTNANLCDTRNIRFLCQYNNFKRCQRCSKESVSIYIDDIVSDSNKSRKVLFQTSNELDNGIIEALNDHMTSSVCSKMCYSKRLITIAMSGYFLSQFCKTLICSSNYRHHVMQNFFYLEPLIKYKNNFQCININIVSLGYGVIDYKWNDILVNMCLEKRELDHAMSWLSTLGGAFSALGEQHSHFAHMAGRTSIEQICLALRLGDDLIIARCKLYYALSLIQTGHLTAARKIIKQQYEFATSRITVDERLIRMCLGIWAKMKFEHKRRKIQRKNIQSNSSNILCNT